MNKFIKSTVFLSQKSQFDDSGYNKNYGDVKGIQTQRKKLLIQR